MATNSTAIPAQGAIATLAAEWPEYLMEAANLGLFMISACVFGTLLGHPESRPMWLMDDPWTQRALMGVAMGLTLIGIVHSPMGQGSGAHMNPGVTLTYLSLGRVKPWTAIFYIAFQFAGGVAGVALAREIIGPALGHSAVNYVVTTPGSGGWSPALAAEFAISLLTMLTVLFVSNTKGFSRYTPFAAGTLVALFIAFESPVSGMSMNPARSFGSAAIAGDWAALWIYFVAPVPAMLLAGVLFRLRRGSHRAFCAKLHHHNSRRCIFRCRYQELHDSQ